MSFTQTLAIIKPKAVEKQYTGAIIKQIEEAGFVLRKLLLMQMSYLQAQNFYKIHEEQFFYDELCMYMSSGPVVVMVLAKENAVDSFRELIGATNPADAEEGTLRNQFGTSIDDNAIHGSDAEATADQEIAFFFGK